jgi:hypothetical protein
MRDAGSQFLDKFTLMSSLANAINSNDNNAAKELITEVTAHNPAPTDFALANPATTFHGDYSLIPLNAPGSTAPSLNPAILNIISQALINHDITLPFRVVPQIEKEIARDTTNHNPTASTLLSNSIPATLSVRAAGNEGQGASGLRADATPFLASASLMGDITSILLTGAPNLLGFNGANSNRAYPTASTANRTESALELGPPAPSPSSEGHDWRSEFLDSITNIPLQDAMPVDLTALRNDANAFFTRLVDLDADWTTDFAWSEYAWLAAGILLASGGVCAARRNSRPCPTHKPRLL